MKRLYKQRVNDIAYCERELKRAAMNAEKECIQKIKEFQSYRKKMRRAMEAQDGDERGDEEEYGNALKAELEKLENSLMHTEMSLQQVLNSGTETFKDKLNQNLKTCKEDHVRKFFDLSLELIENYN